MEHIYQKHDILSHSKELRKEPDVQLFTHLWNVRVITDGQLQELRKYGRLSPGTPFLVPQRPEIHRHRRKALRRRPSNVEYGPISSHPTALEVVSADLNETRQEVSNTDSEMIEPLLGDEGGLRS
jgi:hypothetical protein